MKTLPNVSHELKTWPDSFEAMWVGDKKYDFRKNDRNYKIGDVLLLKEYVPEKEEYTGREMIARVTYMTVGGKHNLPEDMCIMGIIVIGRSIPSKFI